MKKSFILFAALLWFAAPDVCLSQKSRLGDNSIEFMAGGTYKLTVKSYGNTFPGSNSFRFGFDVHKGINIPYHPVSLSNPSVGDYENVRGVEKGNLLFVKLYKPGQGVAVKVPIIDAKAIPDGSNMQYTWEYAENGMTFFMTVELEQVERGIELPASDTEQILVPHRYYTLLFGTLCRLNFLIVDQGSSLPPNCCYKMEIYQEKEGVLSIINSLDGVDSAQLAPQNVRPGYTLRVGVYKCEGGSLQLLGNAYSTSKVWMDAPANQKAELEFRYKGEKQRVDVAKMVEDGIISSMPDLKIKIIVTRI